MSAELRISDDADLTRRNSFGVPARARRLVEATSLDGLRQAHERGLLDDDTLIIGGGSNLLWVRDPDATVLALRDVGQSIIADDGRQVRVRARAGGDWHALVMWSVAHGLGGLENLALIPGTVGAAPIQNIGAYGVEVGEHIAAVQVLERATGQVRWRQAADCGFGYRDSVFKRQPGRWIVTGVELLLSRQPVPRLEYAGLREALGALGATPTPEAVAEAVIAIRRSKLPDPAVLGNAGSFFKNPVVPLAQAETLAAAHPGLPVFAAGADAGSRKLSAAWLIERSGWKGHRDGDAGIAPGHALVLVNHGRATGAQLLALARKVAASVHADFGVAIEPEPRLVGAQW